MKSVRVVVPKNRFSKERESKISQLNKYKAMSMGIPNYGVFKVIEKLYLSLSDKDIHETIRRFTLERRKDISFFLSNSTYFRDFILVPDTKKYTIESAKSFVMFMVLKYIMVSYPKPKIGNKVKNLFDLFLGKYDTVIKENDISERNKMFWGGEISDVGESTYNMRYQLADNSPSNDGTDFMKLSTVLRSIEELSNSNFPSLYTDILVSILKITAEPLLYISGFEKGKLFYDTPLSFLRLLTSPNLIPSIPHINIKLNHNDIPYILNVSTSDNELNIVLINLYKNAKGTESLLSFEPNNLVLSISKNLTSDWVEIASKDFYPAGALAQGILEDTTLFIQGNRAYLAVLKASA